MLEYYWLFAVFLKSERCFIGAEGKWTLLPPILLPFSRTLIFKAALPRWSYPLAHICVKSKGVGKSRNEANKMEIEPRKLLFHWLSLLENCPMEEYVTICTELMWLFLR